MSKILVASSFYADYALYETSDREALIESFRNPEIQFDTEKHRTIGSSECDPYISIEEAQQQADETIFMDDFD